MQLKKNSEFSSQIIVLCFHRNNNNQLFQIIKIKNLIDIRYENQINFFLGDNKVDVAEIHTD